MNTEKNTLWSGSYKIPWDDPDFSRRMLAEHLSQQHDMASRRMEWIERQVAWIHTEPLGEQPAHILDLGCGPGFYAHRLGALGHTCHGIDFGPAAIAYAQEHASRAAGTTYELGDIREVAYGGPYDLVMLLFGEINVFSPAEALKILKKAQACLKPKGRLIIEPQHPEAVKRSGCSEAAEFHLNSGLFSDMPHTYRIENQWFPEEQIARQIFLVTEDGSQDTQLYYSTNQCWPEAAFRDLLSEAGFKTAAPCPTWPSNTEDLQFWIATIA